MIVIFQDWSLRIQRVYPSDSGTYKCQANSHPPQFIATYLSIHGNNRQTGIFSLNLSYRVSGLELYYLTKLL